MLMTQVWISAAGLCGATVIGSLLGFFVKELPHRWNDTILGYCAGIMLAASTLGLIVPAFDLCAPSGWWMVTAGVVGGALFLNVLDFVTLTCTPSLVLTPRSTVTTAPLTMSFSSSWR